MTAQELKRLTDGVTTRRLAELTDRSTATISAYLAGTRPVPLDVAIKVRALAEALDMVQHMHDDA